MSLPLVRGFRYTGIIVKNMENSRWFYEGVLGLEVVQNYKDGVGSINK